MARIKKIRIKGFTIIDNDIINDPRMHLKALGLFTYMWSKPDDWQFYISEIASHFKDGESAVSSAMKELMKLGYLKRTQNRKDGKFSTYDYILQETPKPENPSSVPKGDLPKPEKPKSEKPIPENRGLLNTDSTNTDSTNTEELGGGQPTDMEKVFNLWQQNWGFPNGIAQQDLTEWVNDFGTDLVCHAIEYALRRNVSSSGADRYLMRTFERYKQEGVTTVKQAEEKEEQHYQQTSREMQAKGQGRRGGLQVREQIPEWMKHPYKKPKIDRSNWPDDSQDVMPQ